MGWSSYPFPQRRGDYQYYTGYSTIAHMLLYAHADQDSNAYLEPMRAVFTVCLCGSASMCARTRFPSSCALLQWCQASCLPVFVPAHTLSRVFLTCSSTRSTIPYACPACAMTLTVHTGPWPLIALDLTRSVVHQRRQNGLPSSHICRPQLLPPAVLVLLTAGP